LKPFVKNFKGFDPTQVRGDVDQIRFKFNDPERAGRTSVEDIQKSLALRFQQLGDSIHAKAETNQFPSFEDPNRPIASGVASEKPAFGSHDGSAVSKVASRLEGYSKNQMSTKEKGEMLEDILALKGLDPNDPRVGAFIEGLPADDFAFATVVRAMREMDAKTLNRVLANSESPAYRTAYREFLEKLISNKDLMENKPDTVFALSKQLLENYDLPTIQKLSVLRGEVDGELAKLTTKDAKVERAEAIVSNLKERKSKIAAELEKHSKSGDQVKMAGAAKALNAIDKSISDIENVLTPYRSKGGENNHGPAFDSVLRQAVATDMLRGNLDPGDVVKDVLDGDYLVRRCGGSV